MLKYVKCAGLTPVLLHPDSALFLIIQSVLKKCKILGDTVTFHNTTLNKIKSFKHKGFAELFELGRSRRVRQDLL